MVIRWKVKGKPHHGRVTEAAGKSNQQQEAGSGGQSEQLLCEMDRVRVCGVENIFGTLLYS